MHDQLIARCAINARFSTVAILSPPVLAVVAYAQPIYSPASDTDLAAWRLATQ